MKRALLFAVFFAAPAFAQREKAEEEAGDVSEVDKDRTGPLRDRVQPVSGHIFLMKGRFEASPEIGISFKDPFYTKYAPGLMVSFHFTETVGISLRASYAFSTVSGAAEICTNGANGAPGCRTPTLAELDAGSGGVFPYGRMGLLADLALEWAPIYGKLATLAVLPFLPFDDLHFNMYGGIGPAVMMYGPASTFTGGGNVHVGFRFFVNKFICVRTEIRDVVYYEQFSSAQHSIRNQLMFDLGLSFFLPTNFERE
jgi:outer membrane beta-barrel protein